MRALGKPLIFFSLVLAIPIVPFLLFGESLEASMEAVVRTREAAATLAWVVIALLATDVFLPVPSSVVSTVAGETLGFGLATTASWVGMCLGAAFGFLLARGLGRTLVLRFASEEDVLRLDRLSDRYGPSLLICCRPLPVLAEASVLLLGTSRIGWWQFFLPVSIVNLVIAAAYAALGRWVHLPTAIVVALVVPALATLLVRRSTSTQRDSLVMAGEKYREYPESIRSD